MAALAVDNGARRCAISFFLVCAYRLVLFICVVCALGGNRLVVEATGCHGDKAGLSHGVILGGRGENKNRAT